MRLIFDTNCILRKFGLASYIFLHCTVEFFMNSAEVKLNLFKTVIVEKTYIMPFNEFKILGSCGHLFNYDFSQITLFSTVWGESFTVENITELEMRRFLLRCVRLLKNNRQILIPALSSSYRFLLSLESRPLSFNLPNLNYMVMYFRT